MTTSQNIRITQIADIVAEQQNVSLPEGARPAGLNRLVYVLEKAAGITPKGGRTDLGRLYDCFKSGKVGLSDEPELPASIAVKTMPAKVAYIEGDELDTAGLVLTVTYNTGDVRDISSGFTVSPTTLDTAGTQEITVSYTESEETVSCTFDVSVASDIPVSLAVSGIWENPQTVETAPDLTGLSFEATYLSGKTGDVTASVSVSPATWGATAGEQTATFSYTEKGETVTCTLSATVAEAAQEGVE